MPDPQAQAHSSHLQHQFDSYEQQRESASLGMWVFIAQEIMFFGGLFLCYAVYRSLHPDAFAFGSRTLDIRLGSINTAVLIASSLTMALAVWGGQLGKRKTTALFLLATIALGSVFLGIKADEYHAKYVEHHVPGPSFHWEGPGEPKNVEMFFNLYFAMTGLHALHMVVGIVILFFLVPQAWRGRFTPENHNFLEGFGLYWHFVDIIWIFLFPLLYLIGRHG